jgi:hypothetical protein
LRTARVPLFAGKIDSELQTADYSDGLCVPKTCH